MARTFLAVLTIGAVYLAGCNNSQLDDLRASYAKLQRLAEKSQAEAATIKAHAANLAADAQGKLALAEKLKFDAAAHAAAVEKRFAAAKEIQQAGQRAKTEAKALLNTYN